MNTIYCNECKKVFPSRSININETQVNVMGKVLILNYIRCPNCNALYRVLLVNKTKYRELVEDLNKIRKRINNQYGKGNPALVEKLLEMADKKQKRIHSYVNHMNSLYSGGFALERTEEGEKVIYIP